MWVIKVGKEYTQKLVSFPSPGPENKLPRPQTLLKKIGEKGLVSLANFLYVLSQPIMYMPYVIMW